MDVFYEQMYKKNKGMKGLLAQVLIISVALILSVALFMILSRFPFGAMIGALAIFALAYGAYKLFMQFDLEYEYIYLNGEIDFDKIIAKNSRERVLTVKGANVDLYGVYDEQVKAKLQHSDIKKTFDFRSGNDATLYYMTTKHKEHGKILVIFEPDERIREDLEKHIPKQW